MDLDGIPRPAGDASTSLFRGLRVLETLAAKGRPLTITEISRSLRMNKTSVYRFLNSLIQGRYVVWNPESKRYTLGLRVLDLGFAMLSSMDLPRVVEPHLAQLHRACGEATNFAVLDGTDIVIVARVTANHPIAVNSPIGARWPVHCTSMGKAILATLPEEKRLHLLERLELRPRTDRTVTTRHQLEEELARVRSWGFAVNDEESIPGLCSLAAPVLEGPGDVVGAINITAPTVRLPLEKLVDVYGPSVVQTAREISARLGYRVERGTRDE